MSPQPELRRILAESSIETDLKPHDSLASSPPKQTEVPKPTAEEGETKTEEATATSPTSPTHKEDGYPRPEGGHHDTAKEGEKDEKKKEEQHANKKKEKKEFDHVKQQNFNKNPPAQNNYTIKQPAGKTMM